MLKIAYAPIYKYTLPAGHRFPMDKYELIPEQLLYEAVVEVNQFFQPKKMPDDLILSTHSSAYLNKLNNLNLDRKEIRDIGFPVRKELIERGKYISHGTLECAYHALENRVAMNVAGGTHHAYSDRGEGFCIFNDFALTANILLARKKVGKILIVDLDVHQGNGTAKIFENDNRVYTFSMHGERNYPLRKEKSDLDIGLPDGCEDDLYLKTLNNCLPDLLKRIAPDMVFYLAGVDILKTDKLGRLSISKEACKARDLQVFSLCHEQNIPVIVSMGGGYSERVADIVDAHCNTFKAALEVFF